MIDRKFFFKLGPEVVAKYRKHTFIDGKDVNGKKFKKYSKKYGQRKKANKFKRQATQFKDTNSPVLTSDLLRDWKLKKVSSTGFSFGTVAWGDKVKHLNKMGRLLSTKSQPIPEDIQEFIDKEASNYGDSRFRKEFKDRDIDINL